MDFNLTSLEISDEESADAEDDDDGAKLFVRFVNKSQCDQMWRF